MEFKHITEPKDGSKITFDNSGALLVPDNPIIPFIEGDGIGSDITPAMINVVDTAVAKSYFRCTSNRVRSMRSHVDTELRRIIAVIQPNPIKRIRIESVIIRINF